MNITIFSQRLQECRRRKYSSQQAFADAYMERFGMIRQGKKKIDNNMFGTIQSWEQGKSTPTADVLANYLLGRIGQRTHDITDAHRYTGLSTAALEQLHEYRMDLSTEPNWEEIRKLEENWSSHKYYRAYALYLIDELLTGSKTHKLSIGILDRLFQMIYEEGIGVNKEDYENDNEYEDEKTDNRELWAVQTREQIDIITYLITNNIRDILYENTVDEKLPDALRIDTSKSTYFFSVYD